MIAIKHVIQLIKQLIATASSSQLRAAVIQMQEKLTNEKKKYRQICLFEEKTITGHNLAPKTGHLSPTRFFEAQLHMIQMNIALSLKPARGNPAYIKTVASSVKRHWSSTRPQTTDYYCKPRHSVSESIEEHTC